MKEIYVIANPLAGDKRGLITARRILNYLRENKIYFKYRFLKPNEKIPDIIRRIKSSFEYILVIGGDGTVRSAVEGIIESKVKYKLICFPGGTGSELSIYAKTTTMQALFKALSEGEIVDVDVFLARIKSIRNEIISKYFIANLQIGHFALGVKETPPLAKRLFYGSGYMIGIIKALLRRRNRYAVVKTGKKQLFSGFIYAIHLGNVPTTRGGIPIAPFANPTDARIDMMLAKALNRKEALKALPKALEGTHLSHPAVIYKQLKELRIFSEGDHLAIDGEYLGLFREIRVIHHGKIQLLCNKKLDDYIFN